MIRRLPVCPKCHRWLTYDQRGADHVAACQGPKPPYMPKSL